MGRFYSVNFENVAVSAAQDLFEINPASNKPVRLHQVMITNVSSETTDQLRFAIKRITATFASGSGGASVTPVKLDAGDPAASCTCERNNTSRATGTSEVVWAEGQNVLNGWNYLPTPECRPVFTNGTPLIVGLEAAPASSTNMSGVAIIEEMG